MPTALTYRRATLIAAAVALLVYLPSLRNGYALDDSAIIERNPAAQSVGAALRAFGDPYWPPGHEAGLWRPMVILSFAADYQLSGGSTAWLHATNTVLHAVVTGLVVLVLAPYTTVAAALAGGLLFAVHPVHVEAVANLVGRSELLAALFLLPALLVARSIRHGIAAGRGARGLPLLLYLLVAMALLSKEHAVIAVALLWLDQKALATPGRLPVRHLVVVLVMTLAWLLIRARAEGGAGFDTIAPTFFGLDAAGRWFTMMPVVLTIVRLLVWPFELSADYHPQVIERLTTPTWASVIGAMVLLAVIGLAAVMWRRQRAVSLGLLVAGLAWIPTSNLLLPTGIVLSERTMYLPSVGIVIVAAGLIAGLRVSSAVAGTLVVATVLAWSGRTITRIPLWRSTRDVVVTSLFDHPESYKLHQWAARTMVRLGARDAARAEYRSAMSLYELDDFMLAEAGHNEIELGNPAGALRPLRQAESLNPSRSITHQGLAHAFLLLDSVPQALRHARAAVAANPRAVEASRLLTAAFLRAGNTDSARLVWPAFRAASGGHFDFWLLSAATFAATGLLDSAAVALDSAAAAMPGDSVSVRRLAQVRAQVAGIR